MARPAEVSDEKILQTAEDLLKEKGGNLDLVSRREVARRAGGGNERVNRLVRVWKEERAQKPHLEEVEQVTSPVPDVVTQVLEEATKKLVELGPLVARLIDSAVQGERRRSDMAVAAEREAAKNAVETVAQRLQRATEDADGYAGDLDEAEQRNAELNGRVEVLEASLEEERSVRSRLEAEIQKVERRLAEATTRAEQADVKLAEQKDLYEKAERARSDLEARIAAVSEAQAAALKDERAARHEEIKELRFFFQERLDWAERTALEGTTGLREANETIEALKLRLGEATQTPGGTKSSA